MRLVSKILTMFLLIFFVTNVYAFDLNPVSIEDLESQSGSQIINPYWEEYNKLTDEEKAKLSVIPEKYITEYDNKNEYRLKSFSYAEDAVLPDSYNLSSVDGVSYITPVKDQSSLGICWAFASNASLESNLLKLGLVKVNAPKIYSERQIDYITAFVSSIPYNETSYKTIYEEGYNPYVNNRRIGYGGNFSNAAPYMAMGVADAEMKGIWQYFTTAHNKLSLKDVYDIDDREYVVSEYVNFPTINNTSASTDTKNAWRKLIKNHLVMYGGVYTTTIAPQTPSSYSCYVNASDTNDKLGLINWNSECESAKSSYVYDGLHAMTIIGWDDNYTQSYCALPKNGTTSTNYNSVSCKSAGGNYYTVKGAWLLKNSWGSSTQFVHLEKNKKILDTSAIKTSIRKDFDNTYNTLGPIYYQKDTTNGSLTYLYLKGSTEENLERISFETSSTSLTEYTAYLDYPSATEPINLCSISINLPGRYSIDFDSNLLPDSWFSITITSSRKTLDMSNIFAFTTNVDNEISGVTLVSNDYSNQFGVRTRANNLKSGSVINYKIYDSKGNDISNNFGNLSGYIVAGAYTGNIAVYDELEDGVYYIETIYNGNRIGYHSFAINLELSGLGTKADPYLINSVEDLDLMYVFPYYGSYFALNNDLNLSYNYNPNYFSYSQKFIGHIDGKDHTINNLSNSTGFFDQFNGTAENIRFNNVNMNCDEVCGVFAAETKGAIIKNISVFGSLKGSSNAVVGGVVGDAIDTDISNVYIRANFNGGYAGSVVGNLEDNSKLSNVISLSNYKNTNSSLSTFASKISMHNNSFDSMIDYIGNDTASCNTNDYVFDKGTLNIKDVFYYTMDKCRYVGMNISGDTLRNASLLSDFDKNIWSVVDGKLPSLKKYQIAFYDKINITSRLINIYSGDKIQLSVSTVPSAVTYPGLSYSSSNLGVASVSSSGLITTYSEGLTTITISANDGSHVYLSIPLYVLSDAEIDRVNNYVLYNQLQTVDNLNNSEYSLEISGSNYIGTGMTVKYLINNNIVAEHTAVVKGDLSGDGEVDSLDLAMMLKHVSGAKELEGPYLYSAKLNSDDEVDSLDLAYLLNKVAGKEGY